MTQQAHQKSSGGNTGKIVAIGCGVVLLVAVAASFLIYFTVKKAVLGYVENFTAAEAVQLADPAGSKEDAQAVIAHFDAFVQALETGAETEPLSLESNEVNQLIFYHPRWAQLSDKVRVTIEGDDIGGQLSLALDDLSHLLESLKGRYLNGSATFTVGLTGGHLLVFLEALEVNGKSVPEQLMKSIKTQNLAENANGDPDFKKLFELLKSIEVEDGKLTVVPKPASERPAEAP